MSAASSSPQQSSQAAPTVGKRSKRMIVWLVVAPAVVLLLASLLLGEDLSCLAAASPRAWGGLAYLAVFGSLVGFTAFAYCLNELPASTVSTYAYVNPAVAVTLGALILDEPLTAGLLTGGALILVAVILTTLRRGPA